MQAPPVPGSSLTGQTVEQRMSAVEARLAALEKLLVISTDGALTVKATKVSLQAPNVEVKAANSIQLYSGLTIDFKAGSDLTLGAGGFASVKGQVLKLNGSVKPLARAGDTVNGVGAQAGVVGVIAPTTSTVWG